MFKKRKKKRRLGGGGGGGRLGINHACMCVSKSEEYGSREDVIQNGGEICCFTLYG